MKSCHIAIDFALQHIRWRCASPQHTPELLHSEAILNRFTVIDLCALAATVKPLRVCETIVTTMT